MHNLLLTLSCLFALCALYGFIKFFLLTRDYNYRRRLFDDRVAGRQTERRKDQRRLRSRDEISLA